MVSSAGVTDTVLLTSDQRKSGFSLPCSALISLLASRMVNLTGSDRAGGK